MVVFRECNACLEDEACVSYCNSVSVTENHSDRRTESVSGLSEAACICVLSVSQGFPNWALCVDEKLRII